MLDRVWGVEKELNKIKSKGKVLAIKAHSPRRGELEGSFKATTNEEVDRGLVCNIAQGARSAMSPQGLKEPGLERQGIHRKMP